MSDNKLNLDKIIKQWIETLDNDFNTMLTSKFNIPANKSFSRQSAK
jgi:hypothetical protein